MLGRLFIAKETCDRLVSKFAMSKTNYWFTYISDGTTAAFFLAWEIAFLHAPLLNVLSAWFAGWLLWGLSEYCFHRWIYHSIESVFRDGHDIHHDKPLSFIAMPWFLTSITLGGLWYLSAMVLHIPLVSSVLAGWLTGFMAYSLVHHGIHHWDIQSRWTRRLKAYHRIHHQMPHCNYGVTMGLWDRVFGTEYKKPRAKAENAEFSDSGENRRSREAVEV